MQQGRREGKMKGLRREDEVESWRKEGYGLGVGRGEERGEEVGSRRADNQGGRGGVLVKDVSEELDGRAGWKDDRSDRRCHYSRLVDGMFDFRDPRGDGGREISRLCFDLAGLARPD